MALRESFPSRGLLRRPQFRYVDLLVGAGVLALLYSLLRLGLSIHGHVSPHSTASTISTEPAVISRTTRCGRCRGCSSRSVLSVVFTFVYGTAAARSRRAEKVLIPLLDILQSVPILGFLTITVTFFIALFPRLARSASSARSIFAIFTSQAWNMTFSFYHSLITQPAELDEAARLMRLTKWERFWKLDVPGFDDRPGVERDDELRRRLVLPRRIRGDHGREHDLRAARHRQLRRRRRRQRAELGRRRLWRSW